MKRYTNRLNIKGKEHLTSTRMVKGWLVISKTRPLINSATLPIYWLKQVANDVAVKSKATVIRVSINYQLPFGQTLTKRLKKSIGILAIFILPLFGQAQTVLPNAILDTMIMEVKYARQCGITLEAIQAENKALGEELLHTGTALELSERNNETLSALLNNARDYSGILTQQFTLDKNKLKAKIKRLWIWVTTEGVVIVVLIILL